MSVTYATTKKRRKRNTHNIGIYDFNGKVGATGLAGAVPRLCSIPLQSNFSKSDRQDPAKKKTAIFFMSMFFQ